MSVNELFREIERCRESLKHTTDIDTINDLNLRLYDYADELYILTMFEEND